MIMIYVAGTVYFNMVSGPCLFMMREMWSHSNPQLASWTGILVDVDFWPRPVNCGGRDKIVPKIQLHPQDADIGFRSHREG